MDFLTETQADNRLIVAKASVKAELLKRLLYMENSWDDSRVTEYVTQRERSIAILTIGRMRQHIEAAFRGEILEGKPIQH